MDLFMNLVLKGGLCISQLEGNSGRECDESSTNEAQSRQENPIRSQIVTLNTPSKVEKLGQRCRFMC